MKKTFFGIYAMESVSKATNSLDMITVIDSCSYTGSYPLTPILVYVITFILSRKDKKHVL